MDFKEHKESTLEDLKEVQTIMNEVIAEVEQGNMKAFEAFWISGGTEEGDPKIAMLREILVLRYFHRDEQVFGPAPIVDEEDDDNGIGRKQKEV